MAERLSVKIAEAFCEDHFRHRALIKEAVEAERLKRLQQRQEFAAALGASMDPNAEAIEEALKPIEAVRIKAPNGAKGMVWRPEAWAAVFVRALSRFKEFYGDEAVDTIRQHYDEGVSWVKMSEGKAWKRIVFQDRRRNFLQLLLIFAVQEGLVHIE